MRQHYLSGLKAVGATARMSLSMGNAVDLSDTSFADPKVRLCPFPLYERLREDMPVFHDPQTGNFVLTRYDDVKAALLNYRVFSNRAGVQGDRWCEQAKAVFAEHGWLPMDTLVSNDPPDHRFFRKFVDKAFAPAKVAQISPRIEQIVDQLIADIPDGEEFDFVSRFAMPLPMTVIAEQLGVDPTMIATFKKWSDALVETVDPTVTEARQVELAHVVVEMQQYFALQIARVRAQPDETILSRLANAEVDGKSLLEREIQSLAQQILGAGNETTTTTLASGMRHLIDRPDLVQSLRAEPERAKTFVEETLRAKSPIQTLFRRCLSDIRIGDVEIPAGARVEVRYGAANSDPAHFDRPAHIDLDRSNAESHLAFGWGIHNCIGNQLAREQLRIAFQALVRRFDHFRPARGSDSYRPLLGHAVHGFRQVWMICDRI